MKVQVKILVLLSIVITAFFAVFIYLRTSGDERMHMLMQSRKQEKENIYDRVVTMKGQALQMIVNYEYSIWDEMVDYVKRDTIGNKAEPVIETQKNFEEDNIDLLLDQYGY